MRWEGARPQARVGGLDLGIGGLPGSLRPRLLRGKGRLAGSSPRRRRDGSGALLGQLGVALQDELREFGGEPPDHDAAVAPGGDKPFAVMHEPNLGHELPVAGDTAEAFPTEEVKQP